MITSPHNPKLQQIRALLNQRKEREEAQAFVVEGVRLTEEAFAAGWPVQLVIYSAALSERGKSLLNQFAAAGVEVEEVPADLLERISDTATSQGILAVVKQFHLPLPDQPNFLVIADGLRDPGNLGSLLRTASAAGAQGVLLTPGSVDAFAPKVVRSGMGAHFHLPVRQLTWQQIETLCHAPEANIRIYLSDAERGTPLWQTDLRAPLALVIGAEAEGVTSQAAAAADDTLTIPMPGHSESLNAAAAAGILLFEVVRQRSLT